MNVVLCKPMSLDDFLKWEERQALRHEVNGFQPVREDGRDVRAFGDPTQLDHSADESTAWPAVPATRQ